jgi:hypothetical protein
VSAAHTPTPWKPSVQVRGEEICGFHHHGRHYNLRRNPQTDAITYVSKRERSRNSYTYGTRYQPLAINGNAARCVIEAFRAALKAAKGAA